MVEQGEFSIGGVLDRLGDNSFSLICLLLSLPFIQPVSLGPASVVIGFAFMALGWQWANGAPVPVLPERLTSLSLPVPAWRFTLSLHYKVLAICSKISRPRLSFLIEGRLSKGGAGALVSLGGLLMSIPMMGVPFNNTLPALIVASVCIAEIQRDGLFVGLALCFLGLTIVYFALTAGLAIYVVQMLAALVL